MKLTIAELTTESLTSQELKMLFDDLIYLNTYTIRELAYKPDNKKRKENDDAKNKELKDKWNNKPWKNRIVKITNSESKYSIYKVISGKNGILRDNAIMSNRSLGQLSIETGNKIEITKGNQILYRHMYYYNNLNDTVRIAYKIGFYGLLLAIISITLSIVSIVLTCSGC